MSRKWALNSRFTAGSSFGSSSSSAVAAAQLVGRADVGDGAAPEMLGLKQFADEDIAVIHEGAELGACTGAAARRCACRSRCRRAAHRPAASRCHRRGRCRSPSHRMTQFGVVEARGLGQAAMDAAAIAGLVSLKVMAPACSARSKVASRLLLLTTITRRTSGCGRKSRDRFGDAFLVVIGGQRDGHARGLPTAGSGPGRRGFLRSRNSRRSIRASDSPATIGTPLYQTDPFADRFQPARSGRAGSAGRPAARRTGTWRYRGKSKECRRGAAAGACLLRTAGAPRSSARLRLPPGDSLAAAALPTNRTLDFRATPPPLPVSES